MLNLADDDVAADVDALRAAASPRVRPARRARRHRRQRDPGERRVHAAFGSASPARRSPSAPGGAAAACASAGDYSSGAPPFSGAVGSWELNLADDDGRSGR